MDEEQIERMNVSEIARLIDWMRIKGISDHDILECILYIAKTEVH